MNQKEQNQLNNFTTAWGVLLAVFLIGFLVGLPAPLMVLVGGILAFTTGAVVVFQIQTVGAK